MASAQQAQPISSLSSLSSLPPAQHSPIYPAQPAQPISSLSSLSSLPPDRQPSTAQKPQQPPVNIDLPSAQTKTQPDAKVDAAAAAKAKAAANPNLKVDPKDQKAADKDNKDKKDSKDSKDDSPIETNWHEVVESFDDMNLKEGLLRGIYAYGFEKPSAIQQRGIVPILKGRDTIAQAQSGTGKTATFTIAVLQQINTKSKDTQALILAPTRELAQQIQKVVCALGDYLKISSHACVGGTLVRDDIRILRQGVQIVVGTPGRVYDMINRGVLRLNACKFFVLDEADEMLSRGFKDQVNLII